MIHSMTGYGRASGTCASIDISFEIKSVNHRFFECSCHLPKIFLFAESFIKDRLKTRISRGKIDCYLNFNGSSSDMTEVRINEQVAASYKKALDELCDRYHLFPDDSVRTLASFPSVFETVSADTDEELFLSDLTAVLDNALDSFISMRAAEGEKMKKDVLEKAASIEQNVLFIENKAPLIVDEYFKKLCARVKELSGGFNLDENRLYNEVAVFADKSAVDEETVRLRSHIAQLRDLAQADEPVGKKLDFLVQEMNREANTIASKSQDIEITEKAIALKNDIEKIREQVQNIE